MIKPLVSACLQGTTVSCFAYGQTGSGKTFTMMGDMKPNSSIPGLYYLATIDLFAQMKLLGLEKNLNVCISLFEIYCGKAFDLINGRKACPIREDANEAINIVGLTETCVVNHQQVMTLIN
jgi:kinesin family member 2/24